MRGQPDLPAAHSPAWVVQSWLSFGVAILAMSLGIYALPDGGWVKGFLAMGLLLGGLLGRQTIRAIVRPLQLLNETMFSITRGKLDSRIPVERDDETGVALRNLQTLQAIIRFDSE